MGTKTQSQEERGNARILLQYYKLLGENPAILRRVFCKFGRISKFLLIYSKISGVSPNGVL
jgi:hypothetical protein